MSIPTTAEVPRLQNEGDLLAWARRLNEFLTSALGSLILPEQRVRLVNGRNDNINLLGGNMIHLVNPTTPYSISGIGGASPGRLVIMHNDTATTATLLNDDANSQPGNRLRTFGGSVNFNVAMLIWDHLDAHWLVVSAR